MIKVQKLPKNAKFDYLGVFGKVHHTARRRYYVVDEIRGFKKRGHTVYSEDIND